MHDRQQWTAMYVRSLDARMTMTRDGSGSVGWTYDKELSKE